MLRSNLDQLTVRVVNQDHVEIKLVENHEITVCGRPDGGCTRHTVDQAYLAKKKKKKKKRKTGFRIYYCALTLSQAD